MNIDSEEKRMNSGKRMTRILFILIDGLGDCPHIELGNKTPLQYIDTPCMDRLSTYGANGLFDSYRAGVACGSDTAHLSIFGYNPRIYYNGRGAFETEGSGLLMDAGDIAFKCNFAYMNHDTGIVEMRRVDRNFHQWGLELIEVINNIKIEGFEEYKVSAKHATEHRIGLKISGPGLSNKVSDTDPLVDNKPLLVPKATSSEGELTAKIVKCSNTVWTTIQ